MTTLPGLASKGEKGKSKFQSLDINNLYRVSRGESLETQQQKSTLPRKHGMQSLGKVPNARRPPANLPSLKSEHSGTDTAVSLVPSGGPGWGKQDAPTSTTTTNSNTPPVATSASTTPPVPMSGHQAAIALPVTTPIVPQPSTNKSQPLTSTATSVSTTDKSWSAVISSADMTGVGHPPPYQSPQFQHEFPSLSAGDGGVPRAGSDTQYGPGPSLRPQTEGSWMQGGGAAASTLRPQPDGVPPMPPRSNSAPLGTQPQHSGPAGHPGAMVPPPQFRNLIPPFMFKGNFAPNGHTGSNFPNLPVPGMGGRGRPAGSEVRSGGAGQGRPPVETDDLTQRPIIKEEDLNRMDDMTRDVGWATHDDIDYNQKLAFSDDEAPEKEGGSRKDRSHHHHHHHQQQQISGKEMDKNDGGQEAMTTSGSSNAGGPRGWNATQQSGGGGGGGPPGPGGPAGAQRSHGARLGGEDDDLWTHKRRQQSADVAIAVERAKQRREEEEKRFLEQKQAAAKKLQELEQKMLIKNKSKELGEEGQGTINPASVPPQPITPVSIPVPDWDKDRDSRENSRTPNDGVQSDKRGGENSVSDFRQLTQIEGRNLMRNDSRSAEREISKERDGVGGKDGGGGGGGRQDNVPNFSRHFQSNLPPRFQKQQQQQQQESMRHNAFRGGSGSGSSPQPSSQGGGVQGGGGQSVPFAQQYDPRWMQSNSQFGKNSSSSSTTSVNAARKPRGDSEGTDKDKDEDRSAGNRDYGRRDDYGRHGNHRQYSDGNRKSGDNRYHDDYSSGGNNRNYGNRNQDYQDNKKEWIDDRDKDRKDLDKKGMSLDAFDERQQHGNTNEDWQNERRDKYDPREMRDDRSSQDKHIYDRPQRPDSRDSRTSRESRHSRDSIRDLEREYTGSWADSPFDPSYDDNKKKDHYREDRRVVPGPITKEKIEADDLRNEKRNLTQLKRGHIPEKKHDGMKKLDDKTPEKKISDDAWNIRNKKVQETPERPTDQLAPSPKAWADALSPNTVAPENPKFLEALEKPAKVVDAILKTDQQKMGLSKTDDGSDGGIKKAQEKPQQLIDSSAGKDDKRGYSTSSSSRGRSEGNRWATSSSGSGYPAHRNVYTTWSKRGDSRGSRGARTGGMSHRPTSDRSGDWHGSESELSGDEVSASTESGKEDRIRHGPPHSPKAVKKSDKDDKNKDMKQIEGKSERSSERKSDKRSDVNSRREFVPRGEPSRHGRGSFRNRGGAVAKRIDGYGPPPSKSPFGQHDDKDKKSSGDEIGGEMLTADDKTRQNQQALSAGIIGSARNQLKSDLGPRTQKKSESDKQDRSKGRTSTRPKPKSSKGTGETGDECWETQSDNSDTESDRKDGKAVKKPTLGSKSIIPPGGARSAVAVTRGRPNPPPRLADKRSTLPGSFKAAPGEKPGNPATKSAQAPNRKDLTVNRIDDIKLNEPNALSNAIADISLKAKDAASKSDENAEGSDEKSFSQLDSDGFQEVRSKKNVKERQKSGDEKPQSRSSSKHEKEGRKKANGPASQLTPQQIANIPPLLGTPVNPPSILPTTKSQFERPRQNKLPPRLAKQRENNRLQKAQMQQQGMCDVNEMNKINHSVSMYGMKDGTSPASVPIVNAWDKPITPQLRGTLDSDAIMSMGIESCSELDQVQQQSSTSSQRSSPNTDNKIIGKAATVGLQDKAVLDGSTPPVNTIIFENTNYKSAPGAPRGSGRNDKGRGISNKIDESTIDSNSVMSSYKPMVGDILSKTDTKPDPIQMPLFNKAEDSADIDFFDNELCQLTEEKSGKSLGLPRSIHAMTSAQSTISPSTADLNMKIASVKKVWETTMPTVLEHSVGQDDNSTSFSSSFGADPNCLDPSAVFSKDAPDDGHEAYSQSPNPNVNSTANVCKFGPQVKPNQQVTGAGGQAVHSGSSHQQHSNMVGPSLMGHPMSPPPNMQQVIGAGVGLGQPPQQYTTNQHMSFQPSLGATSQPYGMSAIPSPPTVLFSSTQQIPTQTGLYGPFQIDQSQVLGTQGRSQYSQYPNPYGLGQTASSPYSAQSMYLQTPPHPPPSAQPPPDIYQNINSYRLPATGPFAQSQQLSNNQTTVLISSSSSNSLMSASVKPSSQPISAIGTKTGNVGQAYQQQSQQGQQLYMFDPTMQGNYMANTGVMQRGPTGPVQNSVVPGMQPSSSYYSGSTGGQTGYFQTPGNSTLQSAPLHQHQTGFSLQGNVFNTHNQTHSNASLQSFGSQFLSSPMQMAAAAALTAQQQYRSPNPNYMKNVGGAGQHINDQSGRAQQLKSPGSQQQQQQQDVLSSVFNSGPQIPSPKSRQNCKQPQPQPSPNQHKFVSSYPGVGNQQSGQIAPRYPTPIQRPVNFQPQIGGSMQNQNQTVNQNQRHRPTHNQNNRGPSRQYYGGQGSGMQSSQIDKSDDSKMADAQSITTSAVNSSSSSNSSSSINTSTSKTTNAVITAGQNASEKDGGKEEGGSVAAKD